MCNKGPKGTRKDCIINLPVAKATATGLLPSVIASQADSDGNIKSISYADGELSGSTNISGSTVMESYEITSLKNRSDKDKVQRERHLVLQLLLAFNKSNSSNFVISGDNPEQSNSIDVFIKDFDSGKELGVQVTLADPDAVNTLRSTKTLSRQKASDVLVADALKKSILSKKDKFYADHQNLVLALEGWWGFTSAMINVYRDANREFLAEAGFYQIWYVGLTKDTIIQLY